MIHLALETEYSFKRSFLPIEDIHKYVFDGRVGVADLNNTFSHIPLMREAEKHGFTPIYGVRLYVLEDESKQRTADNPVIFIAKNTLGLRELYQLVALAYKKFYYTPRLWRQDVENLSNNVQVIKPEDACGPGYEGSRVALVHNNYAKPEDKEVYQLMAGARRQGEGYSYHFLDQTYPQFILSMEQHQGLYKNPCAILETIIIGQACNAEIPKAEMVKWEGGSTILDRIDPTKVETWTQQYQDRLEYELDLIDEKGYGDYFLIVADMIRHAKKTMLVGPSRGSSAGSLVCYLLDITEVDPVKHKLIFERFIDVNRFDLPDIDIDFPDTKRDGVISYLDDKYGADNVQCLANVNRFKAKSAIGEFAKGLGIPKFETEDVKGAIIERASGDARAGMCILDTFTETEEGKGFIEKYPKMKLVEKIENHASHAGKHAAGIIVSTLPLSHYGSVNIRDKVIQFDKKDAEYLGLLKIDCLGLRTLSILEGVCDQIGMKYKDLYSLPLDDQPTFDLLTEGRLNGIFQFEGQALKIVTSQVGVSNFNDMALITALGRPGALNSNGTARYITYRNGSSKPNYYCDTHRSITGPTLGIVVYQEQMMEIARQVGGLSWADTSMLRRAASKSMGDEFFSQFKDKFIEGAIGNGYTEEDALKVWNDISASGSWSFNKAHAVSYALISYWCAYFKTHHPLEFAVASLNNTRDPDAAVKLLRDLVVHDNIEYTPLDADLSEIEWTAKEGKLIGGLTNLKGIGKVKARKIIAARKGKGALTKSLFKLLSDPVTDFDILFPAQHYWGKLYGDPSRFGCDSSISEIINVNGKGEHTYIGRLNDRNIRDLNEEIFLTRRDGRRIPDDEPHLYLNFKLEDDTDLVATQISVQDYEALGRPIAEKGKIGETWYLVRGIIKADWRRVNVTEIVNLSEAFPKGIE